MLFANTGRFTPLPGWLRAEDPWGTRGTRVTPSLRHPARPWETPRKKPPASPAGPALPALPQGLMPSCPGRCPQTRAGDKARPRRRRSPGVSGCCRSGGSSGSRGRPCWVFHHPPHARGAAPDNAVLCWDKGPGAVIAGRVRLCGAARAGGTVPGPGRGGAGGGRAAGARPGS